MMEFADTHCHIQSAGLNEGERATRELWAKSGLKGSQLAADAQTAGVTRLVCVGCDLEDSRLAVDFVKNVANCWVSVGIHPHSARHYAGQPSELNKLDGLAKETKVVAVGECGLDYHYDHSPKAAQAEVFKFQIELALKHELPLIFHVREAFDDFWPIFDQYQGLKGVLHSFTDTPANLQKALERGLCIGVNGIATFTKDQAQLDAYKAVPLDKLLLETDAPFLAPKPYRGQTNEPKHIITVAEFLARLRGENLTDLARQTTDNACKLFGITK
jgi:TatD DNase family protein